MVVDKQEQEGVVVDFQAELQKRVSDLGKSENFQKAREIAKEKNLNPGSLADMLTSEDVLNVLDLEPEDVFEIINQIEKANPEIIARQKSEITHLKDTCKAHYEKWEKTEIERRKLEKQLIEINLGNLFPTISIEDNIAYYFALGMSILAIILFMGGAIFLQQGVF